MENESVYFITYLTYRYVVSTLEAVHCDLVLSVSNDLNPHLKVTGKYLKYISDLFGGTFYGYEI